MAQLKTSIHNYGGTSNNAGSMGTVNLDPYTYNPRYPGFDEANYRKLESKINALGLTGYEREKAMDEAYQQILPIVQNEIKNSDRREYINQANYEVSQIQDPQARKEAQGKLTVTQLSQQLKEKYNLDPSANDEEVFNSWINSIPDGGKLLADYMNDGNRELLYQGGLEQKIEAPETPEGTVGGIQEIINQQSELPTDTALGKGNNILNKLNLIGWATEGLDKLAQKIPTLTYEKQVENLANKMNNLSEDEIQNLYDRYVNMVRRGSDEKWQDDDRNNRALFWDAAFGDSDAAARLNTLYLNDYSQVVEGGGVERNQRGSQLWDKVSNGATLEDINAAIDAKDAPGISKALAKGSVWTTDKMKNLLNFIGGSYGALQNYAESLGAGTQTLKDIKQNRTYVPQNLENDSEAFNAFVADQTANFGEYITDAPDTLLGKPVDPNVIKFFSNIPQSFIKTLTAKVRAKTNPLDTKVGLAKMLFTEEGQQALINRYGSPEALANAMNTDPIGLSSDMIDMADKFNLVLNKTSGGLVERQSMGDVTDALSDSIVNGGSIWRSRVKGEDGKYLTDENGNYVTKSIDIAGLNQGLTKVSDRLSNKGWDKTAGATDIIKDAALNPNKLAQDITKEGQMVVSDVEEFAKNIPERSRQVREKAIETSTRKIPEKVVENDLKLTPTERANVEKNGITAANFVLEEGIAGLKNEDKIVALQDIASDAYNKVTDTFKTKIPDTDRIASSDAKEMLQIMQDTMGKSDIVKAKYGDYINQLQKMKEYSDYSPYELLAIRRDFDAIVGNDIFNSKGRVTGLEDEIIAGYRASLNEQINDIGDRYGLDVKEQNSKISNAITIRDGLIRSTSQGKKNNWIGLQDLGIGAIMSAGDPVTAGGIFLAKKGLEKNSGKIAQGLYDLNNSPLQTANTKKGAGFIKKSNKDASNRFMITPSGDNSVSVPSGELTQGLGEAKTKATRKTSKVNSEGL